MKQIAENLKRYRLLKNLSLQKAGELVGISAPAINKYEKGLLIPNSERLIDFAKAYGVSILDLITFYDVPTLSFDCFRKRCRLIGGKLELLKEIITNEVAKYLEVLRLDGRSSIVEFPTYDCNSIEDAEDAAISFRNNIIKIDNQHPISDLISILENIGVIIIAINNDNGMFDDFDGFAEYVNGIPVIVFLNVEDGARQRFTISHELGHLLLNNKSGELDIEKLCNRFASALLMPNIAVKYEFGNRRNFINFFELEVFKKEYKVSDKAIVYRLKDLNIISEHNFKSLYALVNKLIGKNDSYPISPEISYQFKKLVYKLEANEIISKNKAISLLGVNNYEDNG